MKTNMEVLFALLFCSYVSVVTAFNSLSSEGKPTWINAEEMERLLQNHVNEFVSRYDTKLESLRNEISSNRESLQKEIITLKVALESERKEHTKALKQLQHDFDEKERVMNGEIKNLKQRLASDHNERIKETFLQSRKGEMESKDYATQKADRKRQASVYGTPVAFSARLTNNTPQLSPNDNIAFDSVITNKGSGYNNVSGTFTAPRPGIYFVTTSILAYGKDSHHVKLVKNGQILTNIDFNDADLYDHSSQSVVVELNTGDVVAVQNEDYTNMIYHGYYFSTFSGFLLYEYEDASQIVGK